MPHLTIPEAEEILDREFPVLDHGFVRLVDYMGGDQRIVDAARVSYQAGTTKASTDSNLIRYLLRHKHTTPFEKVRFEFHIKIPIFVMRQWIRHRMSSTNEESARYSVMKDEFYIPDIGEWRKQSTTNRQGSSDIFSNEDGFSLMETLEHFVIDSYDKYEKMIAQGVSREMARMILPVNLYTEFYWTIDLWNLMNFLRLRLDSHAQLEIQKCAAPLEDMARAVCPVAMGAWTDYIDEAENFSRMEVASLRLLLTDKEDVFLIEHTAKTSGMETRTEKGKYSREFKEFLSKLGINEPASVPYVVKQSS